MKHTLEAFADGFARDIHKVTLLENLINCELLARLKAVNRLKSEFLQVAHGDGPRLLQVAKLWFCQLGVPHSSVAHLHCIIPAIQTSNQPQFPQIKNTILRGCPD
jgi:hypothetical protein